MEPSGEDELIQLVKISVDGTNGSPITISKTSAERASGFPQMELLEDALFLAWTLVDGEEPHIEMAKVFLQDL